MGRFAVYDRPNAQAIRPIDLKTTDLPIREPGLKSCLGTFYEASGRGSGQVAVFKQQKTQTTTLLHCTTRNSPTPAKRSQTRV